MTGGGLLPHPLDTPLMHPLDDVDVLDPLAHLRPPPLRIPLARGMVVVDRLADLLGRGPPVRLVAEELGDRHHRLDVMVRTVLRELGADRRREVVVPRGDWRLVLGLCVVRGAVRRVGWLIPRPERLVGCGGVRSALVDAVRPRGVLAVL